VRRTNGLAFARRLGGVVLRVSLRCRLLAVRRRLLSPRRGSLALPPLPNTFEALNLTRLSSSFARVGEPLPPVGGFLASVGLPLSLFGHSLAIVRGRFPDPRGLLSRLQLRLPHLRLDLAGLELDRQLVQARSKSKVLSGPGGRVACVFGGNQLRRAPFQCRASPVERGRIAVQARTRAVALLLPERSRLVVDDREPLMTSSVQPPERGRSC
jgi:hypothetical protein